MYFLKIFSLLLCNFNDFLKYFIFFLIRRSVVGILETQPEGVGFLTVSGKNWVFAYICLFRMSWRGNENTQLNSPKSDSLFVRIFSPKDVRSNRKLIFRNMSCQWVSKFCRVWTWRPLLEKWVSLDFWVIKISIYYWKYFCYYYF